MSDSSARSGGRGKCSWKRTKHRASSRGFTCSRPLEIGTWLDEQADAAVSEYLLASQARSLMDKLSRDLQIAGIAVPDRHPSPGVAYLPVFAAAADIVLKSLGIASRQPTGAASEPEGRAND
jgi:hypothetical protein